MSTTPTPHRTVGRTGQWLGFLARMEGQGYEAINPAVSRKEAETVALRCRSHPDAIVERWTRTKFGQWLATFTPSNQKHIPPPCPECAKAYALVSQSKHAEDRAKEKVRVDARLAVLGHKLVSHRPVTVKDKETGKVKAQSNEIQCLACKHIRSVFLYTTLKRAEAKKSLACPNCNPNVMGPKPKVAKIDAAA